MSAAVRGTFTKTITNQQKGNRMTTPETAERNESIEKGIFLTLGNQRLHACKVREDLGCGVTKCGITFLVGGNSYKGQASFDSQAPEDSASPWRKCEKCLETTGWSTIKNRWERWKRTVKNTLAMIGGYKV